MKFLSSKVHTIVGLVVGIVLLLAPEIFGLGSNQAAMMVPRLVGIFIIISELVTTSPYSLFKLVPMGIHLVIDYVTGIFLAASPWLFGFAGLEVHFWLPHLLVGIMIVLYALVTNPSVDANKHLPAM